MGLESLLGLLGITFALLVILAVIAWAVFGK